MWQSTLAGVYRSCKVSLQIVVHVRNISIGAVLRSGADGKEPEDMDTTWTRGINSKISHTRNVYVWSATDVIMRQSESLIQLPQLSEKPCSFSFRRHYIYLIYY